VRARWESGVTILVATGLSDITRMPSLLWL
jgi:hypothetical protein